MNCDRQKWLAQIKLFQFIDAIALNWLKFETSLLNSVSSSNGHFYLHAGHGSVSQSVKSASNKDEIGSIPTSKYNSRGSLLCMYVCLTGGKKTTNEYLIHLGAIIWISYILYNTVFPFECFPFLEMYIFQMYFNVRTVSHPYFTPHSQAHTNINTNMCAYTRISYSDDFQ